MSINWFLHSSFRQLLSEHTNQLIFVGFPKADWNKRLIVQNVIRMLGNQYIRIRIRLICKNQNKSCFLRLHSRYQFHWTGYVIFEHHKSQQVQVFLTHHICFDFFEKEKEMKTNNFDGSKTSEPVVMFKTHKTCPKKMSWYTNNFSIEVVQST